MTGKKETIQIEVKNRKLGKGQSRSARTQKLIPAVIYGPKTKNQPVLLEELFVTRYGRAKYESTIFSLKSDEMKELSSLMVLIKDVQKDPVTHRPVHVDLFAPDMSASIRVHIELTLVGTPEGVKTEGGQLMQNLRDIEVECQPNNIPEAIEVNVAGLHLNESIHVSDLVMPEGVEALTPGERTIATVTTIREEAEPETEVAETTEEGAAEAPEAEKKEED